MNVALTYLWLTLLKRRALYLVRCLRRPATLIGFAALVFLISVLFHYRRADGFAQLVRTESLIGGAILMMGGALFKGFLQRGLVFEPPDIEFLFTSPFTQRQIIFYRFLPNYLFAFAQSVVFYLLFESHLKHPVLTSACLMLFQIVCFHVAAGSAIFAGSLSERTHHRCLWMLLGCYFVVIVLYLRTAWDLHLVPSFVSSPFFQILFYPAANVSDISNTPVIGQLAIRLLKSDPSILSNIWQPTACIFSFSLAAVVTLGFVLRLKANIFESSLERVDKKLVRRTPCPVRVAPRTGEGRVGRASPRAALERLPFVFRRLVRTLAPSLPNVPLFRGVGAIIWKNLVVASRSKRQIMLAAGFTFIYTGFLIALRVVLHRLMTEGGQLPERDLRDFENGLASMLVGLSFFLQRSFPFDFRRDGQHLVTFRTLPISPLALALAEISVPTFFCLAFQAVAVLALMLCGRFDWFLLFVMLLGFPAVTLALNGVWNLHYLLAATKRAGGKPESASSVTVLMVVALSFLIFYPAGWAAVTVGRLFPGPICEPVGFGVWLIVQYAVDLCLILLLAKLFQRFEVADEPR
jgi:Putative ABC exporter